MGEGARTHRALYQVLSPEQLCAPAGETSFVFRSKRIYMRGVIPIETRLCFQVRSRQEPSETSKRNENDPPNDGSRPPFGEPWSEGRGSSLAT